MIQADDFIVPAQERGYNFYTGVPCSFLTPFINRAITSDRTNYVGAASEGEAVAIAAGVPLECGEGKDFKTFRLGLFGLDKLQNADRTISKFKDVLDKIS